MDFSTTDEHIALRQAAAGIAARFGNEYYTREAEARELTSELWQALGKHGYPRLIRSQRQAGLVPGRRAAFPPQRGNLCRLDRTNMPAFIRAHHAPAPAIEALLQG